VVQHTCELPCHRPRSREQPDAALHRVVWSKRKNRPVSSTNGGAYQRSGALLGSVRIAGWTATVDAAATHRVGSVGGDVASGVI
jgi:hypothetical protein